MHRNPRPPTGAPAPGLVRLFIVAWTGALTVVGTACGDGMVVDSPSTLVDIQELVFTPACATAGCHDTSTRAAELDLSTAEASFRDLVGVPARNAVAAENGWLRVMPGQPELSFLTRKLEAPGVGEGAAMPVGAFELTPFYRDLIAEWIRQGAEP